MLGLPRYRLRVVTITRTTNDIHRNVPRPRRRMPQLTTLRLKSVYYHLVRSDDGHWRKLAIPRQAADHADDAGGADNDCILIQTLLKAAATTTRTFRIGSPSRMRLRRDIAAG